MTKISTIIFDLGGVLIDWNPDYVFRQVNPEEAVFIDDNEPNILGAEALQIKGIHFKSPAQLRETFEQCRVLP